jgi:hypothetical protein
VYGLYDFLLVITITIALVAVCGTYFFSRRIALESESDDERGAANFRPVPAVMAKVKSPLIPRQPFFRENFRMADLEGFAGSLASR